MRLMLQIGIMREGALDNGGGKNAAWMLQIGIMREGALHTTPLSP